MAILRGRRSLPGTAQASLLLAAGTLLSQFLQFGKLLLITAWFGASSGLLDSYFASMRWPLLFQGVMIGALVSVGIPLALRARAQQRYGQAAEWTMASLGMGILCLGGLSLIGIVFGGHLVRWSTPGFSQDKLADAVSLLPWCLCTMLFLGLSDLLAGFYHMNRRFLPASAVTALGLGLSIGYLVIFRHHGPMALVHGGAFAAVVQFTLMVLMARRFGGLRFRWVWLKLQDCRVLFRSTFKMVVILSLAYLTGVIDLLLASLLPSGQLSVLELGTRLHDVVIRLSVVSLATALFPVLGTLVADGRSGDVTREISRCLFASVLFLVPLGAGILLFGPWVMSALFERGQFGPTDTQLVSVVWGLLSLALIPSAGVHITARALQSGHHYRPAFLVGLALVFVHGIVGFFTVKTLGLAAIPLSHIASQSVAALLSYLVLARLHGSQAVAYIREAADSNQRSPLWFLALLLVYLGFLWGWQLLALGSSFAVHPADHLQPLRKWMNLFAVILPAGIAGLLYLLGLIMLGAPGLSPVRHRLLTLLGRKNSVEPFSGK